MPTGTGAPDRKNRCPIVPGVIGEIGEPIGALLQALPSFELNSGFVPVKAVLPPLEAKKA